MEQEVILHQETFLSKTEKIFFCFNFFRFIFFTNCPLLAQVVFILLLYLFTCLDFRAVEENLEVECQFQKCVCEIHFQFDTSTFTSSVEEASG